MTQVEQDRMWMERALELARRGIGVTSPNPAVGCVVLDRAGQVVGEGWHEYDLLEHAEVVALKEAQQHARERVKGGTVYVTLEPCNHQGRTGPCTQALIGAGVARVVMATGDPNPKVAGHGADALRAAGSVVEVGVCEAAARRLNEGFACWITTNRPLVLMKVAMTLDGRIGPPPGVQKTGEIYWITNEQSRAAVQPLRWHADAAVTGVDTVLTDDPLLTDRSGLRRRRKLLRVVLDSALRMPLESKIVKSADGDVVVFTMADMQPIPAPEQLPVRQKMTGIGNSHIAIKANAEAQAWFDQGLSLLHDFWDYESAKAFEQAIRVDPQCAMCYWGLAQAEGMRGGRGGGCMGRRRWRGRWS
jgi:diaminohydroxyphosphoribosylaminopyrimidine deaminase/5-amino-6-(5-phosphoribosylamino)uracil reductase